MEFPISTKAMKTGIKAFLSKEKKLKKAVLVVRGMIFKNGKNILCSLSRRNRTYLDKSFYLTSLVQICYNIS